MFGKTDPAAALRHQLAAAIAAAKWSGVDRKIIRQALKDADEGLKDPFANKVPYAPPQPPRRKLSDLAAFLRNN
jgi:hypothetical protein